MRRAMLRAAAAADRRPAGHAAIDPVGRRAHNTDSSKPAACSVWRPDGTDGRTYALQLHTMRAVPKSNCAQSVLSAAQSTTVDEDCCISASDIARRQHLRSAGCHQLFVYRDTGVLCSVVEPFLWLARRPGTRYQTTCEIRRVPLTVFAGLENVSFLVLLAYTAR